MTLENIASGDDNYLVFHEDFDDFPDAISVVFPLPDHSYMTVYVDMDNMYLDRFAEKYGLAEWRQREGHEDKYYPFSRFYTLEPMKRGAAN
jgi:hypothetical protein